MKRFVLTAICAIAVAGCVNTTPIQMTFEPAAHEFAHRAGRATISGQAFLRRNDGIVVYAAGSPVVLMPKTPYTDQVVTSRPDGAVNYANADQRLSGFIRIVQADGEGKFSFANVGEGDYYVGTQVRWLAGNIQQGGTIYRAVSVAGAQSVNTIVTQ